MSDTIDKLKKTNAFACLECGKCTAVCPISRYNESYSPRRMVAHGLFYGAGDLVDDRLLWSCLTCQLCSQRCPVDVHYSEYMRDIRSEAVGRGRSGDPSHGGTLQYIMEIATSPELKQERTSWIGEDLRVKRRGEILYFVGCLPYYQDFFAKDFEFDPISIARDTVRILNALGIEPVVMENERCCGHDLYWLGRLEAFDELGRLNMEAIEKTGATTIVTSCPECALALGRLYPERLGGSAPEVKHISEVIAERIGDLPLDGAGDGKDAAEGGRVVAFQDPCRLGRFLGVYDAPRAVIEAIPGVTLSETTHSRRGAICCGTTNWTNCDAVSKMIQNSRIEEAAAAGAGTLVTACPKCRIHLRCAQCGEDSASAGVELIDLVNLVADALRGS